MPELHAWQWALGALCAIFVGVAKTGVPGFGILVVPLMVFTVGNARAPSPRLAKSASQPATFARYSWTGIP